MQTAVPVTPLPIWQNWFDFNSGNEYLGAFEYPLYSDAFIVGQFVKHVGPYAFSNTMIQKNVPGVAQVPMVLRYSAHTPGSAPDYRVTDARSYHGGDLPDEVAALASLCMGVRLRAGPESRRFMVGEEYGHPGRWDSRPTPTLGMLSEKLVLPDVLQGSWNDMTRLQTLTSISIKRAVALVRSARLYQDALWISESEPALAWLLFVSALETAANEWRTENGTLVERFTSYKPKLVAELHAAGGDALVELTASHIEHTLGATNKFVKFAMAHLPDAPDDSARSTAGRISWETKPMKEMLGTVYAYRSEALHGGQPMPAPMCQAPFSWCDGQYVETGTIGSAASSKNGIWRAEDVPVNLNTFHYIVRGVLLRWWDSMVAANPTD